MKKIFSPQQYNIEDIPGVPFIDVAEIDELLTRHKSPSIEEVREVISHALNKERLSLDQTAILLGASTPTAIDEIKNAAEELKQRVYGNRIVLFAPLYIGNRCSNDCSYCGFRVTNASQIRKTLEKQEIIAETRALEKNGHKRLILVYGEHPQYSAEYIADTVRTVYSVKEGNGEIRRVNINAAPFDVEGFRTIKEAGIGTYQIFQETYNPSLYKLYHRSGKKSSYDYRITALDRAMEAGIDDVGIGALLGLGDYRFEVMAMVRHTNHLEACFGVGPHTISFPRIKEASEVDSSTFVPVNDSDFVKAVTVLRLAVPYTGMILTAREDEELRNEVLRYGISQIDGGTKIEIGGYSRKETQELNREQFTINDNRSLGEIIDSLTEDDYIPSFCTACYRKGRTGEHFMEFSTPGFIKRFCTPNAIFTLAEYLEDYGTESQKDNGYRLIESQVSKMEHCLADLVRTNIEKIKLGQRDLLL